jgi:hypothetical protein
MWCDHLTRNDNVCLRLRRRGWNFATEMHCQHSYSCAVAEASAWQLSCAANESVSMIGVPRWVPLDGLWPRLCWSCLLHPGWEVASDVSRVLCCLLHSAFYHYNSLLQHFLPTMQFLFVTWYQHIHRAVRLVVLSGSRVHQNLPPISLWYGFCGITMFQQTILEQNCFISCLSVANLIVPQTVLALARCTPFGLALHGTVQEGYNNLWLTVSLLIGKQY